MRQNKKHLRNTKEIVGQFLLLILNCNMKIYLVYGSGEEEAFRGVLEAFRSKKEAIAFAVDHFKFSETIVLERFIEEINVK